MSDTHIFLRLPNIKGESTTQGYYEDIEIESISWDMGVKSKGSKASDANEKQQVELGSLTISKHFDIATTGILKRLKAQKRARAGGGSPAFMRMKIVYADVMPGRGGGTTG